MQQVRDITIAISVALAGLPRRHKLRAAILANGAAPVPAELFARICAIAGGKPVGLSWKSKIAMIRVLSALSLDMEQRKAALALVSAEPGARRLIRHTIKRFLVACAAIALVGGSIAAGCGDEGKIAVMLGSMLVVGPIFYLSERDQWEALREAAWNTLGRSFHGAAMPLLIHACFLYGPKSKAAALRTVVAVIESLNDEDVERLDFTDLAPIYRLLTGAPQMSLVWLRLLSIHGTGSSLAAVEQVLRKAPGRDVQEKAGEVAAVLTRRRAAETARQTLLRGSSAANQNPASLLRAATSAADSSHLLIASEGPRETP